VRILAAAVLTSLREKGYSAEASLPQGQNAAGTVIQIDIGDTKKERFTLKIESEA